MEESDPKTLFPILRYDRYILIDIFMNIEFKAVKKFMFKCCKWTRNYSEENWMFFLRGFIHRGLIPFDCSNDLLSYHWQERFYLEIMN